MIAGYRCNYCSTFLTSDAKMAKHEQSCVFNPANQQCCTCRHKKLFFALLGGGESCAKEFDFISVEEKEIPCPGWAPKKQELRKVM
ncbi:MAG: hypothetical protein PF904_00225 [Kiritimatiellae bacterium]|jgi:hypothetical protein|nr:hypothetical protein [Kiritimatiellia bacterium]